MGRIVNLGEESSGFNPSDYKTFNFDSSVSLPALNTWVTALELSGVGFISKAMVSNSASREIRVSVDGAVVAYLKPNSNSRSAGVILEEYLKTTGATNYLVTCRFNDTHVIVASPTLSYPIATVTAGFIPLAVPIFFYESCKVEIRDTASAGVLAGFTFIGGLKA